MSWIRVDTDLEMDRKFRRLSGTGRALLQFVWRLAKKNEGKILAEDWCDIYFADMIGFDDSESIKKQMTLLTSLNFVEPFEDGHDLFIPNWDKYQKPKDRTNAERQKRYREKKKSNAVTSVTGNAITNNEPLSVTRNGVHTYSTGHTNSTVHTHTTGSALCEFIPMADIDPETSTDAERDFELFYAAYPNPQKKPLARTAYMNALGTMPSVQEMIARIDERVELGQWSRNELQWIPAPARYLSEEGYNDPVVPRVKKVDGDKPKTLREQNKEVFDRMEKKFAEQEREEMEACKKLLPE